VKKRLLPSTLSKKSTDKPKRRKAAKDEEEKEKPAETSRPQPGTSKCPIAAPLHRQAHRRLASGIAYEESRQEMHKWAPVIMDTRTAEQIHFPLGEPRRTDGRAESGADRAKGFEPRTQLELLTAEVLGQSKYNLKNREPYCEAEKEILKAMSVKEVGWRGGWDMDSLTITAVKVQARRRCSELQRTRALMSFQAAKFRRQKQIKSKQ
jgi:U3 small nucleolar RNA-associated protein 14